MASENPYDPPRVAIRKKSAEGSGMRWSASAVGYLLLAFIVSAVLVGIVQAVLLPELPAGLEDSSMFLNAYGMAGLLLSAGIAWVSVIQKYGNKRVN